MTRWTWLFALAGICLMSTAARAEPELCATMVADIMRESDGMSAKSYTNTAAVEHAILNKIKVACHSDMSGVIIETPQAFPTNSWFYLTSAVIVAISGKDDDVIQKAIQKCHLDIRKNEHVDLEIMMGKHQLVCAGAGGATYIAYWLTSPLMN